MFALERMADVVSATFVEGALRGPQSQSVHVHDTLCRVLDPPDNWQRGTMYTLIPHKCAPHTDIEADMSTRRRSSRNAHMQRWKALRSVVRNTSDTLICVQELSQGWHRQGTDLTHF